MKREKLKLYPHQQEALRRVLKEPFYFLFMEQGTGKTPVAIRAIRERYLRGECDTVVIYAPNSILYNWEKEIHKFIGLHPSRYRVLRLDQKKEKDRRESLDRLTRGKNLKILIVNYEKSRIMYKELKNYKAQMVVVDEAHKLKNRNSTQSKNIYKLTRKCKYRIMMTGTPICNGIEDLFMQYKIGDESILGGNYGEFEREYIIKGGYMNYEIVGYRNKEKLRGILDSTSYRVRLRDCLELPPDITTNLYCDMSPKQDKAYRDIKEEMLTQVDRGLSYSRAELKAICRQQGIYYEPKDNYTTLMLRASDCLNTASCDLAITQVMRMQQISGGFLTLDSGEVIRLGNGKLKLLREVVMDSTRPIVVFAQYVFELDSIYQELSGLKRNGKPLRVESFRDKKRRKEIYNQFQKGRVDVILLQLKSGSVGLNLQVADQLVMYSWNFSYDDYAQARARIIRAGQKNHMRIIHLVTKHSVDEDILKAIQSKRVVAAKFID